DGARHVAGAGRGSPSWPPKRLVVDAGSDGGSGDRGAGRDLGGDARAASPACATTRSARSVSEGPLLPRSAVDARSAAGTRPVRTGGRARSAGPGGARGARGYLLRDVGLRRRVPGSDASARDAGGASCAGPGPAIRRSARCAGPAAVPVRLGFRRGRTKSYAGDRTRSGLHAVVSGDGVDQ